VARAAGRAAQPAAVPALVWRTSPSLTLAQIVLRLVRALLPVATLYVGKLIIDEVVSLVGTARAPTTCASGGTWDCSTASRGCSRSSSRWRSSPTCSAARCR
jgi:hypothetical protein